MKSKIILSSALLMLLWVMKVNAQVEFGIKGGASISGLSNFNGDDRFSGHGGFFLHQQLNNRWCFQPELLMAGTGERYNTSEGKRTLGLGYLQLPLMFQYFPQKNFYFELGPQLGVLTAANVKAENGVKTSVQKTFTDADFAVKAGLGVKASRQLGIYARYNLGLTDITKYDNVSIQNRAVQVGISWKF